VRAPVGPPHALPPCRGYSDPVVDAKKLRARVRAPEAGDEVHLYAARRALELLSEEVGSSKWDELILWRAQARAVRADVLTTMATALCTTMSEQGSDHMPMTDWGARPHADDQTRTPTPHNALERQRSREARCSLPVLQRAM
jgi:hypothetical protein